MQTSHLVIPCSPSASQAKAPTSFLKLVTSRKDADVADDSGRQLLTAVWRSPDQNHQIGSLDRTTQQFRNHPVKNVGEALQLTQAFSAAGKDTYLAVAVYKNTDSRTAANASGAYAFWMDIDCGDAKAAAGKGYATEADALRAVEKFCNDAALPMPTHIVSSGGGLHLYWVLESVVDRGTWQAYAGKLKALTKALSFLADDSRTSDIASVLRVPGTLNFKYQPPRLVTLLQATDAYIENGSMFSAIDDAFSKVCSAPAKTVRTPSPKMRPVASNDDADTANYGPPDLENLASALIPLDPDCEEITWTLQRLAPMARAAGEHPELEADIRALAISWSSGELRGQASTKWSTAGSNGKTGEQAFAAVWQRFRNDDHTGSQTTLGTIYHDAKEGGWIAVGQAEAQFQICETVVIECGRAPVAVKIASATSIDLLAGGLLAGNELTIAPQSAPAATVTKKSNLSPLATMQQHFCLIKVGGTIWIIDGQCLDACNENGRAQNLVLFNKLDGALMIRRAVAEQFPAVDPWKLGSDFLLSPETVCYDGVGFNPRNTTRNLLNLWVGPTITPKSGAWPLIKSFLLDVICDRNPDNYAYLISYIAHALQCPWEKPGVMIILIGGQGTGKGTLGRILRKIWKATYLLISNIDAVTGNFNASLERAYIVFMDEALFSGNRRASDALKSLVTEETIYINEKHQPARQVDSYHRFIAATNADHFKNTERDDRRDFALRVSEARKGDHAYWTELSDEIENGGVEAMAYELLEMNLTGFNVRNKPETKELLAQKMQSLGPIARWWHDGLNGGFALDDSYWPDFVSTIAAVKDIAEMAGGRLYQKPSAADVRREMRDLCPSAKAKQTKSQGSCGERQRGLSLPDLTQARTEFERYIGGPVEWEPEETPAVVKRQPKRKGGSQRDR